MRMYSPSPLLLSPLNKEPGRKVSFETLILEALKEQGSDLELAEDDTGVVDKVRREGEGGEGEAGNN